MSVLLLMYIYTACYQVTDSFPLHSEVMNIRQRFNVSYRIVTYRLWQIILYLSKRISRLVLWYDNLHLPCVTKPLVFFFHEFQS